MNETLKILFMEDAMAALLEGEERLRLAVENSPIPVMIHDEDGKVMIISKGWTFYSGYSTADIPTIGDWTRVAYGDESGTERRFLDRLVNISETQETGEWTFQTKGGETRIWEFYRAPLGRVSEGKKVFQSLAVDVTESRKMQEMLIRERDRAEESDRLKTAFLHNISHELRTPMNAIIGFSALMAEPGQTDEVRASYSEIIMNSCNQLMDVVSDIIEISNIEADILKFRKEIFDLKNQLSAIHRQYQVRAAEKNLDFDCILKIPDSEALVETDLSKLVTIVTNLLNNAFKFTHEGKVEFSCIKEGDLLRFRVSDTGIGIPEESQGRIFERFYQVEHTATRSYEGAGLGLSISRAYVEFLGGTIWFRSKPGIGSVFEFTVPCTTTCGKDFEPGIRLTGRQEEPVFVRTVQIGEDEYADDRRLVI